MTTQPPMKEVTPCEYAGILGDSEDSEDEPSLEDQLAVSWDDLPIVERLGLSSVAEMTEEEVENAFTQLAMAFRCDQYTLSQRLQAEEHDRTVAQENLSLELQRTRDMLQSLRGRCVDSERSDILSRIEASLDTMLGGMDDIISTAEMLGAVHQEARVSRSVELMGIHVEHLKRRHAAESAELLETRKMFHRSRGRIQSDSTEYGDIRFLRQSSQQQPTRRRVSITLLPTQARINDLETKFLEGCRTSINTDSQGLEGSSVSQGTNRQPEVLLMGSPSSHSSTDLSQSCPLLSQTSTLSTHSTHSQEDENDSVCYPTPRPLQVVLHHRRRLTIKKRRANSEEAQASSAEASELSIAKSEPSVVLSEQPPLASWLSHFRRILQVVLVLVLCFLLLLMVLLWGLRAPSHHGTSTTAN